MRLWNARALTRCIPAVCSRIGSLRLVCTGTGQLLLCIFTDWQAALQDNLLMPPQHGLLICLRYKQ